MTDVYSWRAYDLSWWETGIGALMVLALIVMMITERRR